MKNNPAQNLRGMSLFEPKNWRKADAASPKKHGCEIPWCLMQNFSQSQAVQGSQAVQMPNSQAYPYSLQHPRIFNLSIAWSSRQSILSRIIKLSLLSWFNSSSELSELKINHSGLGNAEPPGSRKHLFLFSARRGNSAFRVTYGNSDCHSTSPNPANSHFNLQK